MLGLIIHMGICIRCGCVLRMSKLFLHRFHTEAETQKHRCAAVTQVMEPDIRQIVVPDYLFEGFRDIVRPMKMSELVHAYKSVKFPVVILSQFLSPVFLILLQFPKIIDK